MNGIGGKRTHDQQPATLASHLVDASIIRQTYLEESIEDKGCLFKRQRPAQRTVKDGYDTRRRC